MGQRTSPLPPARGLGERYKHQEQGPSRLPAAKHFWTRKNLKTM